MPCYEFKCVTCRSVKTVECPMGKIVPPGCNVCKHEMVQVFSVPGTSFKGSGWARKEK